MSKRSKGSEVMYLLEPVLESYCVEDSVGYWEISRLPAADGDFKVLIADAGPWEMVLHKKEPRSEQDCTLLEGEIVKPWRALPCNLAKAALLSKEPSLVSWMIERLSLLDDHETLPVSLIEAAACSGNAEARQWAVLNAGRCET